jgi:hypothetical protein
VDIKQKIADLIVGDEAADKSGWLHKKGHVRTNWNRRFFVLVDGFLLYFGSQPDLPPGKAHWQRAVAERWRELRGVTPAQAERRLLALAVRRLPLFGCSAFFAVVGLAPVAAAPADAPAARKGRSLPGGKKPKPRMSVLGGMGKRVSLAVGLGGGGNAKEHEKLAAASAKQRLSLAVPQGGAQKGAAQKSLPPQKQGLGATLASPFRRSMKPQPAAASAGTGPVLPAQPEGGGAAYGGAEAAALVALAAAGGAGAAGAAHSWPLAAAARVLLSVNERGVLVLDPDNRDRRVVAEFPFARLHSSMATPSELSLVVVGAPGPPPRRVSVSEDRDNRLSLSASAAGEGGGSDSGEGEDAFDDGGERDSMPAMG